MTRKTNRKHNIDGLIALVLFGVFAACVLTVLLTGADSYRRLTTRDRDAYARRTCIQYVATKVRQAPSAELVGVSDFGGADSLCLAEDIGGSRYVTQVYCYDGWLRELFSLEGDTFLPEDGEKIIEAQSMSLSLEDGLLSIHIVDGSGEDSQLTLSIRGRGASR